MELFEYEKTHLNYLRSHLAECTVLLKNNGDFPLEAPCKIAAVYLRQATGRLKSLRLQKKIRF